MAIVRQIAAIRAEKKDHNIGFHVNRQK
jgi:hypothetical protein